MLGIVLESGDQKEIREFIREQGISYTQLLGEDGTKESFGPFLGYPTKYLIGKDGYIVKKYFGVVGDRLSEDLERFMRTGSLQPTDSTLPRDELTPSEDQGIIFLQSARNARNGFQ
jgi:hypothetical protein